MAEKIIRIGLFEFFEEIDVPIVGTSKTETVLHTRIAKRGDVVEISREEDLERGERLGAFAESMDEFNVPGVGDENRGDPGIAEDEEPDEGSDDESDEDDDNGPVEMPDLVEASVEDIADWMESEHPTVDTVLAAAAATEDAEVVQKMLDAENAATGGEPRKGVEQGLAKLAEDLNK